MKYFSIAIVALLLTAFVIGEKVHAQTSTAPVLYNQSGGTVDVYDSATDSLTPGWYYTDTGSPRYYYANGVYYDPASQSYGGSVLYPTADGPTGAFTPGVPNTGAGGTALLAWLGLLLSGVIAIAGAHYLTREIS